ncbi:hypothetical protein TRAPUB_12914 [Trametes pubescens]|uniref:TM7S3/TM198-like domain-containing protein n=1 Tax=Trametes pubescens TaxID=154538 RepID=A0A1M2VSP8_TRAPU|nr:hypothetical protein TRAPUB_12914 [Trametes pubescens]
MAVSFRPNTSSLPNSITALTCLLVILALSSHVSCLPTTSSGTVDFSAGFQHWKRMDPVVVTSDDGTNSTVVDPSTRQTIAQGSATDGGGVDFNVPAIIWLAFVFTVGAPLALVGIRLWRVTTGAGVGLAAALCIWAAFVNTVNAQGLSDLVLTIIVLAAFGIGFFVGLLNLGRVAGIWMLGILSGMSIGIRIVLLRDGLLIPKYAANWFIVGILMIIGLGVTVFRQRFGLVSSCAAVGSFLVALGIDLILNKQSGMSTGLRFLFDRNSSHFLAIVHLGYHPPVITQVLLGASLGAIPVLAFAQHKIFRAPFRPTKTEDDISDAASFTEEAVALNQEKEKTSLETRTGTVTPAKTSLLNSRFSSS